MSEKVLKLGMWAYFVFGFVLIVIGIIQKDFELTLLGLIGLSFGAHIHTDIELDELTEKVRNKG